MRRDHHLRQRGSVWFFQIKIPADVRQHYEDSEVVSETLKTRDLMEARIKRDIMLAEYQKGFADHRKGDASKIADEAQLDHTALVHAHKLLQRNPAYVRQHALDFALEVAGDDNRAGLAAINAHDLFSHGQQPAPLPRQEPVDFYLDDFIAAKDFSTQHADKTRRAVLKLKAWLEVKTTAATLGSVTREVAGDYLESVPGTRKTRVNVAGLLSSYFKYLVRPRGKIDANPFEGLASELEGNAKVIVKRDYRDDEIQKLLSAGKPEMLQTIRVLLLSGLRASELCATTVSDCAHDKEAGRRVFRVHGGPEDSSRKGKTPAAKRIVPVHPDIDGIVHVRCHGKDDNALLFPEWHGSAHALGKWFAEHRSSRGVDDTRPGERQSRIDLHSTRRSFAARAMAAYTAGASGFTPWTVADVLGHDRDVQVLPMTKKYAGLSPMSERIACVDAVKFAS